MSQKSRPRTAIAANVKKRGANLMNNSLHERAREEWADEFERRFLDVDGNWDADMNEPLAVVRFIREQISRAKAETISRAEERGANRAVDYIQNNSDGVLIVTGPNSYLHDPKIYQTSYEILEKARTPNTN